MDVPLEAVDSTVSNLYDSLDLIGVLLNGIIGGTIARQRGYGVIGFLFLALFSALGGGMIRDMLIQRGTVAAIDNPIYLTLAFTGALIAWAVNFKGRLRELFKSHADAIVLGVWAVTGATKAMNFGVDVLPSIFMGVLTAVGGGMVRDVVTGETPTIFGGGTLYAIPAVLSASSMVAFHQADYVLGGMIISPLVGIILAIVAYWSGWVIPVNTDFAPVNLTAAQLRRKLSRAEQKGRDKRP
ncbi:trimeric intracellular cation channel family protein [Corynebacterium callunae]|uniref:trimeric intracellular cation channel family protein n=1 Tax=Corynebacterium callunae TaxID=1721 RepID=UPI003981DB81